jgi:pyruvate/2-oxoglutarate/acetoin dehydrogenase E1 component
MNAYKSAIYEEMKKLARIPNSIFLGQQVAAEDFYGTLKDIPMDKRIELPVAEELQLGMSIGMALKGYLPISIYQRMDFLPRACDQLVNHLDLIEELSCGKFKPKVIIRTTVGSRHPLDTGLQHSKNLIDGFKHLLKNIAIVDVKTPQEVKDAYHAVQKIKNSIIIVEYQELY